MRVEHESLHSRLFDFISMLGHLACQAFPDAELLEAQVATNFTRVLHSCQSDEASFEALCWTYDDVQFHCDGQSCMFSVGVLWQTDPGLRQGARVRG